jgi:flagellar biosynthesis/type III secretory pathway chaperone
MKQYRALLQTLLKETKIQEKILGLLAEERGRIVHLEREELEKLAEKKEALLNIASELRDSRREIFSELKTLLRIEDPKPKLTDIADQCDEEQLRNSLKEAGASLRDVASRVNALNSENGILLKQSLGLLSSTIAIMTAQPQVSNTNYSRNAKITADDEAEMTVVSSFNKSA